MKRLTLTLLLSLALATTAVLAGAARVEPLKILVSPLDPAKACGEALVRAGVATGTIERSEILFPHMETPKLLSSGTTGSRLLVFPLNSSVRVLPCRLAIAVEPFAFRDLAHFAAFAFGDTDLFREMAEDLAREHRVRLLALAYLSQYFVVSRNPLVRSADFKGVKLGGFTAEWFSPLGAQRLALRLGDVRLAAGREVIDAAVLALSAIEQTELYGALSYIQEQPVAVAAVGFFLSEAAFAALPAAERERLARAAREAAQSCSQQLFEKDAGIYRSLAGKGMKTVAADYAGIGTAVRQARLLEAGKAGWTPDDLRRLDALR